MVIDSIILHILCRSCFLCKLVEPKIRSFADDVEYQDIEFYTIDVDVVEDVDGLPETVSTLPTFVLYRGGELQECVAISSDKRPGRSLARAISRVYFTNHGKEEATGA